MNGCQNTCVGYEYILKHYMNYKQLEYYTHRVTEKGLSEAEEVLLEYYFDTDDNILDVGTGCGRFAINAYAEGFTNITGIDINPRFIERAKEIAIDKEYNINFSILNAGNTNFKSRNFESVIFTSDGFSQIPGNENKLSVLKEIYRIMKFNGVFILTVIDESLVRKNIPSYANLIDDFRRKDLWKKYNFYDENDIYIYDGGYMHFATIQETINLVKEAGFNLLFNASAKDILGYNDKNSINSSRFFILRK